MKMAVHYFEITDKETNTQGNFKVIKHLFHCQKDTTANHYHISIDIHNVSEICGSRHCMSIKIQSTHMVSTLFIILLDVDQHVLMRLHVDQLLCLSTGKKIKVILDHTMQIDRLGLTVHYFTKQLHVFNYLPQFRVITAILSASPNFRIFTLIQI